MFVIFDDQKHATLNKSGSTDSIDSLDGPYPCPRFANMRSKATRAQYRIAESTLLTLALLGGALGAYAGRSIFRHKTRKQPFNSHLFSIAVLQMLALGGLIGWWFVC